jgi:deoxyribodipyrimidine photo-lyase
MYCFDPRQITDKTYKCDFVKCDKYRLKFLIETIENLNVSLINKGRCEFYPGDLEICFILFSSGLLTYRDTPENVFKQYIQQFKDNFQISIGFQQEVTQEETDVEKTIRQVAGENNVQVKEFWTSTLYHPDDVPYNNPKAYVANLFCSLIIEDFFFVSFPDVYTQFRVALEKQGTRVRRVVNTPNTLKPMPDGSVIKSIPNLSDFGYSSMNFLSFVDVCLSVFRYDCTFE